MFQLQRSIMQGKLELSSPPETAEDPVEAVLQRTIADMLTLDPAQRLTAVDSLEKLDSVFGGSQDANSRHSIMEGWDPVPSV